MFDESLLARAGEWFARSGIQEARGGVARYYRTDLQRNHPVSTEITGYAASALLALNKPRRALAAANYLAAAWDGSAMPFELPSAPAERFTYFFDCGIIARGLLAVWRAIGNPEFLNVAVAVGERMMTDFASEEGSYSPILQLPSRRPLAYDQWRWSQSPGCYQLKAGMVWEELFEATGDEKFREAYEGLLENALWNYRTFLPGHTDPHKIVDRLHAFLYFLEGLLPRAGEEECRAALCEGIRRVSFNIEKTVDTFERSDVYAQLLRVRLFAARAGSVPLDEESATREASCLAGFQASSQDPRIDGGFYFGRKDGSWLPYINPVSTAFAWQALALWNRRAANDAPLDWRSLI